MTIFRTNAACNALSALAAFATVLAQTGASFGSGGDNRANVTSSTLQTPASATGRNEFLPREKLPQYARARLGTTRLRHEAYVGSFAFSPDGKVLASCGHDGARFWDTATGAPLPAPQGLGDASQITAVEYSPDGKRMAIGHESGLVRLLNFAAGEAISLPQSHEGRVLELSFTADAKTLATACPEDPGFRIWDATSGAARRTVAFAERIFSSGHPLAFSPDGRRLAVGAMRSTGRSGMIGIWDIDSDKPPLMIQNVYSHNLSSIVFSPDGRTIISGGSDRCVADVRQGPIAKPRFGPDASLVPKIRIWDASTCRLVRELDSGDATRLCKIALSRDGQTLISIVRDRFVVWDLPSGMLTRSVAIPVADPGVGIGKSLVLAPDGRTIVASRGDQAVHLWDVASGAPRFADVESNDSAILSAAITRDGRRVATGSLGGPIQLWDSLRGEHLQRLQFKEGGLVRAVDFAGDGQILGIATNYFDMKAGSFRGKILLWDTNAGTAKCEFLVDDGACQLALSSDGRFVAIAAARGLRLQRVNGRNGGGAVGDPAIAIVDTRTSQTITEFSGNGGETQAMAFWPDGKALVCADASATFRCWDTATGQSIREFPIEAYRNNANRRVAERPNWLASTAFARDLKTAVTAGGSDDKLLVWDLESGRLRRTLHVEPYTEAVLGLSPNGRLLAASLSRADGKPASMIRIWDVTTKREVLQLAPGTSTPRVLVFSDDNRTLVSGMSDTSALVWDVSAARKNVDH
jgi:WD40 repeat protein